MPLDGDILGTAINAAINAVSVPQDGPISDATRLAMWKAIGTQIVLHFKTSAVISTAGTATGVTPGPAAVPTVATGTIS